jgi:DNA mismatch repair protein MutS
MGMESPLSAERLMTPTADDRGGSVSWTRREAGFLLPAPARAAATYPPNVRQEDPGRCRHLLHVISALSATSAKDTAYSPRADMKKVASPTVVNLDRTVRPVESADRSAFERSRRPTSFSSILFETPDDRRGDDTHEAPAFFTDLNCDQIVNAIITGKEEYNLKPFFHACLQRIGAIKYRHEVMQDLERVALYERIDAFAEVMRSIRGYLVRVEKLHYLEQKQAWFLDAVEVYCQGITAFVQDLAHLELRSPGFLRFREYLINYAQSVPFNTLLSEARNLRIDLAAVEYCVTIRGSGFAVRKYQGESDYSAEVEATFEKFKQGAANDYRVKFNVSDEMNHIEAKIVEFVAKLHPTVFGALGDFCARHVHFIDQTIAIFDREVQFYIAYMEHTAPLRRAGLSFCYPRVSDESKEVSNHEGFDLALAHKLVSQGSNVVSNDFYLRGNERILVVSGPNQGGKTTFARAFGQLHYLASIGCPVPGRDAQLFLFDQLFTHFEKEEKVENLRGKLEDDLVRVHQILERATTYSIIIMNEIFTSTTIQDEIFLSTKVMETIADVGSLCVWVTFVDELASFGPHVVSMISTVVPDNPAQRTFKVIRHPADGLAYAMAIAQKYGLTYDSIRERLQS